MPKKNLSIILITIFLVFGSIARFYNLFNLGSFFDLVVTQFDWGKAHYEMGPFRFWQEYDKTLDYMPGAMYLDWAAYSIAKLFGGSEQSFVTIMKMWNWIWDILFCILIYRFTGLNKSFSKNARLVFTSLVYALPSLISVSAVWGQIDVMVAMMGIIGLIFYFYANKNINEIGENFVLGNWLLKYHFLFPYFAGIFLGLGYWIKPTAILTVPIVLLLLVQRLDWKGLWKIFIGFLIISIPFGIVPILANPYKLLYIMTLPLFGFGVNNASRDAADLWYLIGLEGYSGSPIINLGFTYITVAHLAFIICGVLIGFFLLKYFGILENFHWKSLFKKSWYKNSLISFFNKKIKFFDIILISTLVNYVYFLFYIKMLSRYLMMGILLSLILMALWDRSKRYISMLIIILITHLAFALNQIYIVNNNIDWIKILNTEIFKFNYLYLLSVVYLICFTLMYRRFLKATQ